MWPKLLITLLLLVVGTPAIAGLDATGCYAVQIISKSEIEQVTSLRLTREAVTPSWGTNGGKRVLPTASDRKFNYSAAYWILLKGELVITFSDNGLSGVKIRARKIEGGFRGTIENFWDFEPKTSNVRPVELRRITCTSGS